MMLSEKRAGIRMPFWARTREMRPQFLRIYRRAQIKNKFRFSYGKYGEPFEVDHIVPLHGENVSGLHVPWNLKILPKIVNRSKGIMIVEEYMTPLRKPLNHRGRKFVEWFAGSLEQG